MSGWSTLREAPPPPIHQVRRRVERRAARRRWLAGGVGAVGAVALGWVALEPGVRDRGFGGSPDVALEAVAEGGAAPRPLADGAAVGPDERVVFFVRSTQAGYAWVREAGSTAVYPLSGTWSIEAGETAVGGTSPQAWRPDGALGALRYELVVCPDPTPSERCSRDALTLRWGP
ncbi:MAG: hypothetical protein ABMA64_19605 [Myxococcota bacterium]